MVVLDLRCVLGGGERERERNIPVRDGVGRSFTVYPGISVGKSLWKSLKKRKKKEEKNHFTLVSGQWQFVDLGHLYILPLIS